MAILSKNYAINFNDFSIEFIVDTNRSIESTDRFKPADDDNFVSIVAAIELRLNDLSNLIESSDYPGNMIETLKYFQGEVHDRQSKNGIENLIKCGEWGRWMQVYWKKLTDGNIDENDELKYEILSNLSWTDSYDGYIAVYKCDAKLIIEVGNWNFEDQSVVSYFSEFYADELLKKIAKISYDMAKDLLHQRILKIRKPRRFQEPRATLGN